MCQYLRDVSRFRAGKNASIPEPAVKGQTGGAESCGSVVFADAGRAVLQQRDLMADAGSVMEVEQAVQESKANTQHSVVDPVRRNPLQEANRDISAHPVRVSNTQGAFHYREFPLSVGTGTVQQPASSCCAGSSLTGPAKVSASQQQSTAAFKDKHLRQMRAANERLERTKVRSANVTTSENSDALALCASGNSAQKRSSSKKQVVQTHVNVSELVTGVL